MFFLKVIVSNKINIGDGCFNILKKYSIEKKLYKCKCPD